MTILGSQSQQDHKWMEEALQLAREAAELGEVPVGAVIIYDGHVVGSGYNRREIDRDPLAHAELIAVRDASQTLDRWRLSGCTLYVTLEPCAMCAGALVNSRIDRLVYAALDPKAGAVESLMQICTDARLNHRMELTSGIAENESSLLLKQFFQNLRDSKSL